MLTKIKMFHFNGPGKHRLAVGILAMFAITGCGGGSGTSGGGGVNSVQYTGNSTAANITEENAQALSNQTFTGAEITTATNNPTLVQTNSSRQTNSSAFVAGKLLAHAESFAKQSIDKSAVPATLSGAQISVEFNGPCPVDGSVRFTGNVDDVTKLGSLSLSYNNCNDGRVIINGSASLIANAYNATIDEYTDVDLIFDNLHFVGVNPLDRIDWQVGANLHAEQIYTSSLDPFRKIATINLSLQENISGAAYKYEDYVVDMTFDRYLVPSTATLDVNGRLYHYLHGYVDVETLSSLSYSDVNPVTYPDAGGPIVYTGAANKKIRLTPVSAVLVNVGADVDGDDFYEYSITLPWLALQNHRQNNNAPVANAGNDVVISLNGTANLDGSLSTDADYNLLTLSWTLTSQPAGSNAGLQGANSANPTLSPDTVGTYVLELMVADGWFSDVDTVTVTVYP